MIEEYLGVIRPKIEGENVPCIFLSDTFLDPIECTLLETKRYERGMPQEYGNHPNERKGHRWLKKPVKGIYRQSGEELPVTLATTTLHLKFHDKFLDSVVLTYDKDSDRIGSQSSVYLVEDGFILSSHDLLKEDQTAVTCWNPGTERTPVSAPYPASYIEAYYDLRKTLGEFPVSKERIKELELSEPCRVAGILVMLCVDAAKEVHKD